MVGAAEYGQSVGVWSVGVLDVQTQGSKTWLKLICFALTAVSLYFRGFVKLWKSGLWKIWRAEWSYTEARKGQVFGTTEMPQCRVRTWLQLVCCALALELGVLILEQQKVAGKVME